MNFLDMIKEVVDIAQKADNIELYRQLLDLNRMAIDIQTEINDLKIENRKLKEQLDVKANIIRHKDGAYITLEDDPMNIHYCAVCWGRDGKLIQMEKEGYCGECFIRRKSGS